MTPQMILDRMDQLIRLGFVNARMPEKMRVKVTLRDTPGGALVTDWLPVLCPRASGDMQYDLPDVGDQVLCVFLSYGLEQGFVVGSMYGRQVPPVQNADKWHRAFRDGTSLEYDRAEHTLTADIKGSATIRAEGPLTLEAPIIYVRGTLVNTATDGSPGKSVFSGGMEVLDGGLSVPEGDVVAAGVSLTSHTTEGVEPGSGTSSHPTGGSAESPGTAAKPLPAPGTAAYAAALGAGLDRAAEKVAALPESPRKDLFRLILCLPEIARAMAGKMLRARNRVGWNYLASFFERWIAGIGCNDPFKGGEPARVDWVWLEMFPRVRDGIADIKKRLFNEAAQDMLLKRLVRDKKLQNERCDFNYIFPPTLVEGREVPEWQQWKDGYFQSAAIEGWKLLDSIINIDERVPDGLSASMASFMIYALAKGYTEHAKEGGHNIVIQQVALVAWDSFNFNGTTDDYRFWRCEPPDFGFTGGEGYTQLNNAPFEEFRQATGQGKDFIVIAGPVNVELEEEFPYHVSC